MLNLLNKFSDIDLDSLQVDLLLGVNISCHVHGSIYRLRKLFKYFLRVFMFFFHFIDQTHNHIRPVGAESVPHSISLRVPYKRVLILCEFYFLLVLSILLKFQVSNYPKF